MLSPYWEALKKDAGAQEKCYVDTHPYNVWVFSLLKCGPYQEKTGFGFMSLSFRVFFKIFRESLVGNACFKISRQKHIDYKQAVSSVLRLVFNRLSSLFLPGASLNAFTNPVVWLASFLTSCTAVLPSVTKRALKVILVDSNKHKVRGLFIRLMTTVCQKSLTYIIKLLYIFF